MSEIYMTGPSVTDEDANIVLDAVRNGWYGKKAYHYVETFERSLHNTIIATSH